MKISKTSPNDFADIVRVHMESFPSFFLTTLGPLFLKTYYRSVSRMPDGIVLKAVDENGAIVGFCAATTRCSGFNKRLLIRYCIAFGFHALLLLFTNFKSLVHLIKNLTKQSDTCDDPGNYAELLSIAVSPCVQGQGVGKALLTALEQEEVVCGVEENSLTTDAVDNEKAIAFYKSVGYSVFYEFTTYPSRKMLRMNKRLKS